MQENDYFNKHTHFKGYPGTAPEALPAIRRFRQLMSTDNVVIIGCGYGRETRIIAPKVGWVWGIDVNDKILRKAVKVLSEEGVDNFTPVLAEEYKECIPTLIDIVYSIVVVQHITRDLTRDYILTLSERLSLDGIMVIQFLERLVHPVHDAALRIYEPSVTWTRNEIRDLAKESQLSVKIHTEDITEEILHHWAGFRK